MSLQKLVDDNQESRKDVFLEHFGVGVEDKIRRRVALLYARKIDQILSKNEKKRKILLRALSKKLPIESVNNPEFVRILKTHLETKYPELRLVKI